MSSLSCWGRETSTMAGPYRDDPRGGGEGCRREATTGDQYAARVTLGHADETCAEAGSRKAGSGVTATGRQKLGVMGSSMPILNPGSEPTPGCPGQGPALAVQGNAVRSCAGSEHSQAGSALSLPGCVSRGSEFSTSPTTAVQWEEGQLLSAQAGRWRSVSPRRHCVLLTCPFNVLYRAWHPARPENRCFKHFLCCQCLCF